MKLNIKHRQLIDELFINNFNQTKAYISIYNPVNPKYACNAAIKIMKRPEVKAYYDYRLQQYKETVAIDTDKLQDKQVQINNMFVEYLALTSTPKLTKEQQQQFDRYYQVFGRIDGLRNIDMLNKVLGSYAPEKTDITTNGNDITAPTKLNILFVTKNTDGQLISVNQETDLDKMKQLIAEATTDTPIYNYIQN